MAEIKEIDLKKMIEKEELQGTYLFYGDEKYTMQQAVQKIVNKFVAGGFSDFNLQRFDGTQASLDEIEAALETLPFFTEKKCVMVSDLDLDQCTAEEITKIKTMVEELPESTVWVIYLPSIDLGKKLTTKWKTVLSIAKGLTVVPFKRKTNAELEKYLITFAEKRGCILGREYAKKIVQLCGTDLQNLRHEIGKLCSYAGSGEITKEQVEKVLTNNTQAQIFALSTALIAGQYEKAYHIVDSLLAQNEEPVMIVAMLSSAYLNVYRAKCMLQSGKSVMDLTAHFEYKGKEFLLRSAEQDSSHFSMEMLRKSLDCILQADYALKGGAGSSRDTVKRVVLDELIANLLLIAQEIELKK